MEDNFVSRFSGKAAEQAPFEGSCSRFLCLVGILKAHLELTRLWLQIRPLGTTPGPQFGAGPHRDRWGGRRAIDRRRGGRKAGADVAAVGGPGHAISDSHGEAAVAQPNHCRGRRQRGRGPGRRSRSDIVLHVNWMK